MQEINLYESLINSILFADDLFEEMKQGYFDQYLLRDDFIPYFEKYIPELLGKRILETAEIDRVYLMIDYLRTNLHKSLDLYTVWNEIIKQLNTYKGADNVNFYLEEMKVRNSDDPLYQRILSLKSRCIELDIATFNDMKKNMKISISNDFILLVILLEKTEEEIQELFMNHDIETVEAFFASFNAFVCKNEKFLTSTMIGKLKLILECIHKTYNYFEIKKVRRFIRIYKKQVIEE